MTFISQFHARPCHDGPTPLLKVFIKLMLNTPSLPLDHTTNVSHEEEVWSPFWAKEVNFSIN